ncbi:MAG: fructosamine kinase family protein [Gammaproteobacteria bacterium]|nr:fructosamine kinase family protein [Gammaproteobacteria bacterium]
MNNAFWFELERRIQKIDSDFNLQHQQSVGGGSINRCYKLSGIKQHYFLKLRQANQTDLFSAETAGLTELHRSQTLRTPKPLLNGLIDEQRFLLLEFINFDSCRGDQRQLATQLVQLHRQSATQFGWQKNNHIGATVQQNQQQNDWLTFWREQRLGFQLKLAAQNGHRGIVQELGAELSEKIPHFFANHQPQASLLHGDLWAGNVAYAKGQPVIFDPAVYYGDRETDLAMTELFGGFSAEFYAAYQHHWPLDEGYSVRKILYNLYHILNHLNLFGGSYRAQAENMMQTLLAEVR